MFLYKTGLLCYNLCWSLLASWFLSDTCFIRQKTSFLRQYIFSVFHCAGNVHVRFSVDCLQSVAKDSVNIMRDRGWGRESSCRRRKFLRGWAHEIILASNLLRQAEAWSYVPVRFPVLQETGETISTDHVGVQPRTHDCDTSIEIATYM